MMADESDELNMEDDRPDPRRRGLGRGLSALFGDDEDEADAGAATPSSRRVVGIDQLEPGPFQPRKVMDKDALDELAESVAVHGVLQPLLVRAKPGEADRFEIIAGERRWRAAQRAQLHEVPVIVKELDEETAFEIALIENLQREDLNALEEAQGYRRLMDDFGHTQEKLAAVLGKSRSHVANMVRLLNLPENVQNYVRQGKLSAGHARTLITASHPEALAREIVDKGLSVREAEKLAADFSAKPAAGGKKAKPSKDVDTLALEEEVSNVLGMKVTIDVRGKGGSLKVDFRNFDQLDEVLHRLTNR